MTSISIPTNNFRKMGISLFFLKVSRISVFEYFNKKIIGWAIKYYDEYYLIYNGLLNHIKQYPESINVDIFKSTSQLHGFLEKILSRIDAKKLRKDYEKEIINSVQRLVDVLKEINDFIVEDSFDWNPNDMTFNMPTDSWSSKDNNIWNDYL